MIFIRKIYKIDLGFIIKLRTNELVRKYLGGCLSKENICSNFNHMINSNDDYYIVSKNLEKIGLISIDTYHDGFNKELSYEFPPKYWNRGYVKKSILKVIKKVQQKAIINVLYAETQTKNVNSRKLLEKLGMKTDQIIMRYNEEQTIYKLELKDFG